MKTRTENLAKNLNNGNMESLEVIREIINISKSNYNYYEIDQDFPELLIDDNGDFRDIEEFIKVNGLNVTELSQFAKFECTQGEQQDDDFLANTLLNSFDNNTIVVKVRIENDDFNQEQSIYYFFN